MEGVAGIAVVAAAHSDGYAATGHLLGLLAALPAPTKAGERFWSDLWRSSGTAYLLPVNVKALVLRSLAGEGTALARQVLSAVDEMTPPQCFAAGEVIGQALVESDHLPDLETQPGPPQIRGRAAIAARPLILCLPGTRAGALVQVGGRARTGGGHRTRRARSLGQIWEVRPG
ncbi:hypothetical protein [Streptomyces aurantiogriseus]|uniref:hypothetical protein n=1 Tax=Streptomyces aurantiogriseus TaxID=66870 RepID=UPI001E467A2C|nr:hypothetical protein [Streptomyces aurantiogriseus]